MSLKKKRYNFYSFLGLMLISIGNSSEMNDVRDKTLVQKNNLIKQHKKSTLKIERNELVFCDKTVSQIITSENLEDIYDAADYFMRDKHNYDAAITLYSKALELDSDLKQAPITKTYLASCYLKTNEESKWMRGATYLVEAAPHYDVALAFFSWVKKSFKLEIDLLDAPKNQAIKTLVELRKNYTDPRYWNIDPAF